MLQKRVDLASKRPCNTGLAISSASDLCCLVASCQTNFSRGWWIKHISFRKGQTSQDSKTSKIASQELQSSKEACAAEVQINPVEGCEGFAACLLQICFQWNGPLGGAACLGGASAAAEVGSSSAAAAGAGGSGAGDDDGGGEG